MNSANKRKVSKAVQHAMNKEGERIKADLNRLMTYLRNEMRAENVSDTDRETAMQQARRERATGVETENASDTDREATMRRIRREQATGARNDAMSSATASVHGNARVPRDSGRTGPATRQPRKLPARYVPLINPRLLALELNGAITSFARKLDAASWKTCRIRLWRRCLLSQIFPTF